MVVVLLAYAKYLGDRYISWGPLNIVVVATYRGGGDTEYHIATPSQPYCETPRDHYISTPPPPRDIYLSSPPPPRDLSLDPFTPRDLSLDPYTPTRPLYLDP